MMGDPVLAAERWPEFDRNVIHPRMPAVPLPLEAFGAFWGEQISRHAEARSAPPDYVAGGLLAVTAVPDGVLCLILHGANEFVGLHIST